MSLNETIDSLATGSYVVTRRPTGTLTDGVYTPSGTTTTFNIVAVQEPATGLQRVVGGFETKMLSDQGYSTTDIRVLYTRTELYAQTPSYDADTVTINGREYVVFRCEPWDLAYYQTSNTVHYRVLCSLLTQGAS